MFKKNPINQQMIIKSYNYTLCPLLIVLSTGNELIYDKFKLEYQIKGQ